MGCGRIRKELTEGWNRLIERELTTLRVGVLLLKANQSYRVMTAGREFAFVLVHGECRIRLGDGAETVIGPRCDPFQEQPYAVFAGRNQKVRFAALTESLIGVASAPAEKCLGSSIITPAQVGGGRRGIGNWERDVRFVCWSDNTEGNMLLAGETCTPSGNWSTIPPHRHQYDISGEEVPYEEAYFFQFSKPQGYGLAWQFDDKGEMDQAFSLRSNDLLYMSEGYHPTVCGPGSDLYHLTFICGPYRVSKARVHPDYRFLLEEQNLENPYARQGGGR